MKRINERQIAETIERECRRDLDKIEDKRGSVVLGIPRQMLVFMAIMAAGRRWDYFSPKIKDAFRDRAMDAKALAESTDRLRKKARTFVRVSETFGAQVESLSQYSKNLGRYLREHGRVDHDQAIPIIASSILTYGTRFNRWKALARVIRVAYIAAGRVADADHIRVDTLHTALLRAAKPFRKGLTP